MPENVVRHEPRRARRIFASPERRPSVAAVDPRVHAGARTASLSLRRRPRQCTRPQTLVASSLTARHGAPTWPCALTNRKLGHVVELADVARHLEEGQQPRALARAEASTAASRSSARGSRAGSRSGRSPRTRVARARRAPTTDSTSASSSPGSPRRRAPAPPTRRTPSAAPSLEPEAPRSQCGRRILERDFSAASPISSLASASSPSGTCSASGRSTFVSTTEVALGRDRDRPHLRGGGRETSWIESTAPSEPTQRPRQQPQAIRVARLLDRRDRREVDLAREQRAGSGRSGRRRPPRRRRRAGGRPAPCSRRRCGRAGSRAHPLEERDEVPVAVERGDLARAVVRRPRRRRATGGARRLRAAPRRSASIPSTRIRQLAAGDEGLGSGADRALHRVAPRQSRRPPPGGGRPPRRAPARRTALVVEHLEPEPVAVEGDAAAASGRASTGIVCGAERSGRPVHDEVGQGLELVRARRAVEVRTRAARPSRAPRASARARCRPPHGGAHRRAGRRRRPRGR